MTVAWMSTGREIAQRSVAVVQVAAAVVILGACGGGEAPREEPAEGAAPAGGQPAPQTPGQPTPTQQAPTTGGDQQLVTLGGQIFRGEQAGGLCYTCHGPDGTGTAIGPSLTDAEWLQGPPTMDNLVRTITTGVPQPRQFPAPMPPMGGAPLTPDQVRAVATYVRSLAGAGGA